MLIQLQWHQKVKMWNQHKGNGPKLNKQCHKIWYKMWKHEWIVYETFSKQNLIKIVSCYPNLKNEHVDPLNITDGGGLLSLCEVNWGPQIQICLANVGLSLKLPTFKILCNQRALSAITSSRQLSQLISELVPPCSFFNSSLLHIFSSISSIKIEILIFFIKKSNNTLFGGQWP